MGLAISEAFKTYIWIRKMIIDKVHHLLHCLAMSLSYSHTVLFPLLLSSDMKVSGAFLLKDVKVFCFFYFSNNHQWGIFVFKIMSLFMFGSKL